MTKKLNDDQRKRMIWESLYGWLEEASIGSEATFRARAGEVAGIVLALGFNPQPIADAASKFRREECEGYGEMQAAADLIEKVFVDVIGPPWNSADAQHPDNWHGGLPGSREALAKAIGWSDAAEGAYRPFESKLRENRETVWCRKLSDRRYELWFKSSAEYHDAKNRLGTNT